MARSRNPLLLLTTLAMVGLGTLFIARFLRGPQTGASAPGESEAVAPTGDASDLEALQIDSCVLRQDEDGPRTAQRIEISSQAVASL